MKRTCFASARAATTATTAKASIWTQVRTRMVPPGVPLQSTAYANTNAPILSRFQMRLWSRFAPRRNNAPADAQRASCYDVRAVSSVNLYTKEISVKIVYYGPGLGGKTSSLQYIHRAIKPDARGQLVSLSTGVDRTLYFDFLPVKLPK